MRKKIFIIALVAYFGTINLEAQIQLSESAKTEVVNNLGKSLLDNYIFADKAQNMKRLIQKNLALGLYDNIRNPYEFADILTRDLLTVYKDLHLSVRYNPKLEKRLSHPSYTSNENQTIEEAKNQNFGFKKVEILEGNIGYIYFDEFYNLNVLAKQSVERDFAIVKGCDALIFDLRNNGGGNPDMVKFICSFLFLKPTHINDLYERRSNKTQSFWTEPVKGFEGLSAVPVFILTSSYTFSAAEEFAYDLQALNRATLIGETTGGGAHPESPWLLSNGFIAFIPYAMAVNPVTKTNWETVGVKPDIEAAAKDALDEAILACYDFEIAALKDITKINFILRSRSILYAKLHPRNIDTLILKGLPRQKKK